MPTKAANKKKINAKETTKKRKELEEESPENEKEAKGREKLTDSFKLAEAKAKALEELNLEMELVHSGAQKRRTKMKTTNGKNLGAGWYYVGPGSDEDKEKVKHTPGLSTMVSKAGAYENGVYRSDLFKGMDILLEDGKASILGKGNVGNFEERMEALFDFLAVAKGTNEFVYDVKNVKDVDMSKVEKVLEIAAKKGYTVELGPKIQQFLLSNKESAHKDWLHKKTLSNEKAAARRQKIYDMTVESNSKAADLQKEKGIKQRVDAFRFEHYKDVLNKEPKLEEGKKTAEAVTKAAYVDEDGKPVKELSDRIDIAQREIKDIRERLVQLAAAKEALRTDIDTYETQLATADDAKKVQLLEFYGKGQQERLQLMEAIKSEQRDLRERRKIWVGKGELDENSELGRLKKELDEVKGKLQGDEKDQQLVIERLEKEVKTLDQEIQGIERGESLLPDKVEEFEDLESKMEILKAEKLQVEKEKDDDLNAPDFPKEKQALLNKISERVEKLRDDIEQIKNDSKPENKKHKQELLKEAKGKVKEARDVLAKIPNSKPELTEDSKKMDKAIKLKGKIKTLRTDLKDKDKGIEKTKEKLNKLDKLSTKLKEEKSKRLTT